METQNEQLLSPKLSICFKFGWKLMKKDFLRLLLVILALVVASIPMGMTNGLNDHESAGAIILKIIGTGYFFLIMPAFGYSASYLFLQSVRGEVIDVRNIISGFKNYLNIVLAHLLKAALIAIGFIALVFPGIIVACRLAFVPYLVMDKNLDPVAAVEESWSLTKGRGWTIFGMGITSFFIGISGLICAFVGVFPAFVWIKSSFAALYQSSLNHNENCNGSEVLITEEIGDKL
jgi:hypothetical protein